MPTVAEDDESEEVDGDGVKIAVGRMMWWLVVTDPGNHVGKILQCKHIARFIGVEQDR